MYVDGHDDIFDMVDIDLFTIVVMNMMVVQLGYTEDMMRQLSFEENELNGEAGFGGVAGSEVSTQEPVVKEVRTQEPIVKDVIVEDYVSSREDVEQGNGQKDVSAPSDGHFFYDDEGIDSAYETQYDVQSSEDAGEDVDVINADDFDSDPGNDDITSNYRRRRLAELSRETEGVINASGQWKYSFYTGQKFTTARCDEKVLIFTMSPDTRPTGPNHGMKAGPSESSGQTTRSKKERMQISMSKAFRAKAKDKREIIGDHVLQYSMLRDYVVELHSTNPNTTVKIAIERNIDHYFPTRVFKRIYVCLGALKLGFRACRIELLGLDGAFIKGSFSGQVLAAVGLDSNNEIYPMAYALVEAESKNSWCWFLQYLGDDIDLHPNSNVTFISARQKVKGNSKKDKIGSKLDKNGKRGEAEKNLKQLQ
nr:transposase, MuDR, MULE transposase domain protein [Tanacetum cinerariifolium]